MPKKGWPTAVGYAVTKTLHHTTSGTRRPVGKITAMTVGTAKKGK